MLLGVSTLADGLNAPAGTTGLHTRNRTGTGASRAKPAWLGLLAPKSPLERSVKTDKIGGGDSKLLAQAK